MIQEGTLRKRERYSSIIDKIDIFGEMMPFEKGQMIDCLNERFVPADDFVIHQGDVGTEFYIIEEGDADALKTKSKIFLLTEIRWGT